ncbi:hypothetical protein E4T52_05709 [Aureobasidium sp. EXF-3400]|nr:hypothetical protein E4T51_04932 [Aureobasidium sp. EXF-12344]KAI4779371.1 hypothetical protein E4T52_05709 [Aureobasidium sp. EXF-3400]
MASQAATDGNQNRCDAITKSPKTIELVSKEDQVVVSVHKKLLCFFSSYYHAALNGKFLEAHKKRFEVDLSGEHLQGFTRWLYTGEAMEDALVELYIFADRVDIMALRRDVISELAKKSLRCYGDVNLALLNLTHNLPLRRFLLDSYIAHWQPYFDGCDQCVLDDDTDADHQLANFIYQVMKGIAIRKMVDPPNCSCCHDICQYHEHESKEEWRATCGQDEDSKMPASLEKSK